MKYKGVIERYREFLPVTERTPVVTLFEGNTPLIFSERLSEMTQCSVYLKYEGANPTGSFKDRGMTVAVSKALEEGAVAVMCASTGNTSASAAAYSAKARLRCIVVIPEGAIAQGKLAQALIHGAEVIALKGRFDDALRIVREITERFPICLVNSINPYRIEGQKTAAFEICDLLRKAPDYHLIPVGNAGNITAYWKGYKEYKSAKKIESLPKMCGFQAEGAAPIVEKRVVENPQTIATAIRIGNPASWRGAEDAVRESGGRIEKVSDADIIEAYKFLAEKEGLFAEPASAASVAGLFRLKSEGYFEKDRTIVCILTGHGLKDPDLAIATAKSGKTCSATLDDVMERIRI
jgi:threonine synthase